MYSLSNLRSETFVRKSSKRVGRGRGSRGKTCGRGYNGQGSRAGSGSIAGFEGGRKPLYLTLPTRGGKKTFMKEKPEVINLEALLERCKGISVVDLSVMKETGLLSKKDKFVKILGDMSRASEDCSTSCSIKEISAHRFSKSVIQFAEKHSIKINILPKTSL